MPAASNAAGTSPGPGSPVELGGQDKAMSWNEGLKIAAFFSVVFGIVFGVHSVLPPMPQGCETVGIRSLSYGMFAQWTQGGSALADALGQLKQCYAQYHVTHPAALPVSFVLMYITMQACAIPGTLWLSILSGALFPPLQAQALVALSATVGSSIAFAGSALVARRAVAAAVPGTLASMRRGLEENRDNLLWYVLFLRITPLFPNWALNLCSPIVGVPYPTFLFATAVGLLPTNYFQVQVGASLARMDGPISLARLREDPSALISLGALQLLALAPVGLKRLWAAWQPKDAQPDTDGGVFSPQLPSPSSPEQGPADTGPRRRVQGGRH